MKYRYDLHIHSALSPCADDDMTPATIAGLAALGGLDIAALTDHNSAKNCAAFEQAARHYGITTLCGLELTTHEDIHVLCLFESAKEAEIFGDFIYEHLIKIDNNIKFFGRQLVLDTNDEILGEERYLLSLQTDIGFNDAKALAESFGGIAIPAHVDKPSNAAVVILGAVPPEAGFEVFEIKDAAKEEEYLRYLPVENPRVITNSDAHRLDDIGCGGGEIELDCDKENLPRTILNYLRNF